MASASAKQISSSSRVAGRVEKLAWSVLAYNIAVVLWGAFVRASGSGAGCGRHWPLCNGEVVPRSQSVATTIEATHRATSGVAVVLVVALLIGTMATLPRGHRARRAAVISTICIFGEAIIGAGLVLFELVAHDASMKRGLSMVLHLSNTFVLLAALALTAWEITRERLEAKQQEESVASPSSRRPLILTLVLPAALSGVLLLGASGAIAALGDTLFPAASLSAGIAQDLSPMAHAFLRLRVLHPVIALCAGVLVLGAAGIVRNVSTSLRAKMFSRFVTGLFVIQFMAGVLNVSLLAPIPMQLVHLFLADVMWIALVLMSTEAWRRRPRLIAASTTTTIDSAESDDAVSAAAE